MADLRKVPVRLYGGVYVEMEPLDFVVREWAGAVTAVGVEAAEARRAFGEQARHGDMDYSRVDQESGSVHDVCACGHERYAHCDACMGEDCACEEFRQCPGVVRDPETPDV